MEERRAHPAGMLREVVIGVVPLLGLIGATLGSILADWPRRRKRPASARWVHCSGVVYRKFTLAGLQRALNSTMATSSMVLLLAVTSNIFGAVFARLGTANWITNTLLSFELPPMLMLVVGAVLIFLLGWPLSGRRSYWCSCRSSIRWSKRWTSTWSGSGRSPPVTLQTAFLSPPVAMSAYYLKQVVKDWSLGHHLWRHVPVHGHSGHLHRHARRLSPDRPVVPRDAAGRVAAQKIPEEHQKIIDLQRRNTKSLEDDDWGSPPRNSQPGKGFAAAVIGRTSGL